jgi:hypothetical protein
MPTEDKPASTAKTTIDLEAVAALDAALCWASPGTVWTRLSLPVESGGRQEVVSHLGKEQHDA